ncbi:DNA polymerase epsilon subunit 3, partial [Tanacetum coccineum]
ANDICKESKRQTINVKDVFKALEEIEFPKFIASLRTSLEGWPFLKLKEVEQIAKEAEGSLKEINESCDENFGFFIQIRNVTRAGIHDLKEEGLLKVASEKVSTVQHNGCDLGHKLSFLLSPQFIFSLIQHRLSPSSSLTLL